MRRVVARHDKAAVWPDAVAILPHRVRGTPTAAVFRVKNPFKSSDSTPTDPADRLARLQGLPPDDPDSDAQREAAARDDEDLSVRRGATAALDDPARLLILFRNGTLRPVLGDVIRARLAERFEADAVDDPTARGFLDADPQSLAPLIAARARGETLRGVALSTIEDQPSLLRVVLDSGFHDVRAAAADRLSDEAVMREALHSARGRDKAVARSLQQRLDEAAGAANARREAEAVRDATLQAMEQLAEAVWSPQHAGRRQALLERWQSLELSLISEAMERFSAADARVQAVLEEHAEAAATPPRPEPGATAGDDPTAEASVTGPADSSGAEPAATGAATGAAEGAGTDAPAEPVPAPESAPEPPVVAPTLPRIELDEPARAYLAAFADVALEQLGTVEASPDGDQAASLEAHRNAVAVLFDPPFALAGSRPAAVQQRIGRVAALLDMDVVLPGIDPDAVPWIGPLAEHHGALVQRLDQARQESSDRLRATVRQFGVFSGLVKEGKWAPASSLFRRIEKKIGVMEDAERREIADRLERARGQLAEMADWQDFASRPKLEETVVEMEALAQAEDIKPPQRAKRVRELQSTWKSLGASRASNELWPRFKTAADAAYEPCKAWFEARTQERDDKRRERVQIVEELEAAVGETQGGEGQPAPDPRALQSRVSRARQGWSRTRINDRKPDKALEARFSAALKPFEALLVEEYERNEAEKQSLVERMTALAAGEIDQHTANRAKSLQSAWKLVGPTRRRQDQTLWEAFNEQARTVFSARREASREQSRAELAHVHRGRAIVDELKKLSRGSAVDEAAVQTLASEFEALAEFPERDKKGLTRAFREALDGVSRQRETGAKRRAQASREEVQRLVELCQRIERSVEASANGGDSGENPLTLADEVVDSWHNAGGEASAPRDTARQLEQRRDAALAHLADGTQPDWAAGEEQRRDLLIRMEVAAELESPSEDRSRRMAFQLQNLQEGMTSGGVSDRRATLAALEQRWLSASPAPAAVAASLESRYLKAMGR